MKILVIAIFLSLISIITYADTYTPTVTNVAHAGSPTASKAQYSQKDNIVHIAGSITVGPDSWEELTKVRITLPVTSNLTDVEDCHGVLGEAEYYNTGSVEADPTNDAFIIKFRASVSDELNSFALKVNFQVDCEIK